jgi:hypothetical protein
MSRLQTITDYQQELAQLDAMIHEEEGAGAPDFASTLTLSSLRYRREALAAELAELTDETLPGHEIDIMFEGAPVHGHTIETEFMGNVLLKVQHLVRSIAASKGPESAAKGPLPTSAKKAATLRFASSFQGSFGMRLEAIQEQPELDGFFALAPTLQSVLDLVNAADTPDVVLGRLAELGPRARNTYRDLIADISSANADVRVVWPNISGPRTARLKSSQATRLLGTLKEIRTHVDGRYYVGLLDQASRRRGKFGFESDDGEKFDGTVEKDVMDQVREFFDRRCRAYILTRVVEHPRTGIVRRSHRLQELLPVEAQGGRAEGTLVEADDDE